jgi:succinoglycan biosynthesis transport protein ExoP
LTLPRFKELLELLREQYDLVLLDTPPLLAVTDPSVVVPRVDGVVLAIRVTKDSRQDAERAKDILESLAATVFGVVVNGSDGPAGFGYQYYHYDRKYQYGYYRGQEEADLAEEDPEEITPLEDSAPAEGNGTVADPVAKASSLNPGRPSRGPFRSTDQAKPGWWRRLFQGR